MHLITNEDKCIVSVKYKCVDYTECFSDLFKILKRKLVCIRSHTDGAAQTLPLLPPFGITQNVNNERGELPSIETGQLLTSLRVEKGIHYSLGMDYMDIIQNIIQLYLVYFCITMNNTSSLSSVILVLKNTFCKI